MGSYRSFVQINHAANDSDLTVTVPDLREYCLKAVFIDYSSTATVGNRIVTLDYKSGGVVHFSVRFLAVPASQSNDILVGSIGGPFEPVETLAGEQHVGLPDIWLPAGFTLRIWDATAVDAAADDMLVNLWFEERSETT